MVLLQSFSIPLIPPKKLSRCIQMLFIGRVEQVAAEQLLLPHGGSSELAPGEEGINHRNYTVADAKFNS